VAGTAARRVNAKLTMQEIDPITAEPAEAQQVTAS